MATEKLYREASQALASIDNDWARLISEVGPCSHQPKPAREPYEALIRAVAYQQLHAKAGDAILARLLALYNNTFPRPAQLVTTDPAQLRSCGFSLSKVETLRGIAEGTIKGIVPSFDLANQMHDAELIERLISLKGIGQWTVEMLLIYTMSRMDILPADDFGVREGYRKLKSLERAPSSKSMAQIGKAWSPYRTIAAWYLWRIPK